MLKAAVWLAIYAGIGLLFGYKIQELNLNEFVLLAMSVYLTIEIEEIKSNKKE